MAAEPLCAHTQTGADPGGPIPSNSTSNPPPDRNPRVPEDVGEGVGPGQGYARILENMVPVRTSGSQTQQQNNTGGGDFDSNICSTDNCLSPLTNKDDYDSNDDAADVSSPPSSIARDATLVSTSGSALHSGGHEAAGVNNPTHTHPTGLHPPPPSLRGASRQPGSSSTTTVHHQRLLERQPSDQHLE